MTSDAELLKQIHSCFLEAERLLTKADTLMRQRAFDREIVGCEKQNSRAGWLRYRAQTHRYVEQYGLEYLKEVENHGDVSEKQ